MKALITSGGRGTRLRPLTHTQNKHLIPIANKPILHYAIEAAVDAGIRQIGIVCSADSDEVQRSIGNGKQWDAKITYIRQKAPLGLAHAVKISQPFIRNDKFIFYLGDNMVVGGIRRFIDELDRSGSNCFLTLAKVKDPERFVVIRRPVSERHAHTAQAEGRNLYSILSQLSEFHFALPPKITSSTQV